MTTDYLLGSSNQEIQRMQFQHDVWKGATDGFLDRIGIKPGWRCLDVGAGPGFVTADLRQRVGSEGSITALEPSRLYTDHLNSIMTKEAWNNVRVAEGTVEGISLSEEKFDFVFVRWVLNFVEDRKKFLEKLATFAKRGGIVAVMDYWYEGLSVHPRGTPFDRLPDIARAYYRSGGGDAYGIAEMPAILREHGYSVLETTPIQLSGGNTSGPFRWAMQFFREHLPLMSEKGLISAEERDAQLKNFSDLERDPEMLFFSPIVLACAMRNDGV